VEEEGEVAENDAFELLFRATDGITIAEMNLLFFKEKYNQKLLQKAVATSALPQSWREYFAPRLKG
jgi:MOSC domain-containing protein YiiM